MSEPRPAAKTRLRRAVARLASAPRELWRALAASPKASARVVRLTVLVVVRSVQGFAERRTMVTAAAIAFFALLSFAPFLLIVASVSAALMGRSEVGVRNAQSYLAEYLPVTDEQVSQLMESLVSTGLPTGGVGLLVMLWTASTAFSLTYDAICHAGGLPAPLVRRRLTSMASVLVLVILLVLGLFVASGAPLMRFIAGSGLDVRPLEGEAARALGAAAVLTLLYKLAAGRGLALRSAAVGGAATALMWVAGKWGFWWAVVANLRLGAVYGAFTVPVMVLVWAYYSACMLLFGAELAFRFERRADLETWDATNR